jgi:Leucine Rich repeats (2 copies)
MAREEYDYQEALRRIKEAEENKSIVLGLLDLSGLSLTRFPPELVRLTSLQKLYLWQSSKLSGDLSPLAKLTSLQSLYLCACTQLSGDLSPLAELPSLQSLNLSGCAGIRQFAPLEPFLARLKELFLYDCRFGDLPPEICGQKLPRAGSPTQRLSSRYRDARCH